jgi:transcriptional regulator with XRE-family HTH domain
MPQPRKAELEPLPINDGPIADRIKRFRKIRGLTQVQLADKIGISRGLEASYESGRIRLYDDMVARFALALDISADALLGLDETTPKNVPSVRFTKRLKELEKLPESKKKALISTLDDLIRANNS